MPKKRLLRLCHKFLSDHDGYDLDVQDLVHSLKDYDNYIAVLIARKDLAGYVKRNSLVKRDGMYFSKAIGCHIFPIFYEKKQSDYLSDLYLKENIRGFRQQFYNCIKTIKPSILHIHGTLLWQFLDAAKAARKARIKVFATHHIGLINQHAHRQKSSIIFQKSIVHNLMPFFCDKIISVSNHGRRSFIFKGNVIVINPSPLVKQYPKKDLGSVLKNNLLKSKFELVPKDNLFFSPGRFHEQKNQLRIVKAFLRMDNSKAKLLLAGKVDDQKYFADVMRVIKSSGHQDDICVLSHISHSDVSSILDRVDYAVLASINEGFGRTAAEALNKGIPVIASIRSGYEDQIDDGRNGALVNPLSTNSILDGLKDISGVGHFQIPKSGHDRYIQSMKSIYRGAKIND